MSISLMVAAGAGLLSVLSQCVLPLAPGCTLLAAGADHELERLVPHDFNGLLRFPADGVTPGAFRAEPPATVTLEAELEDGTLLRP